MIDPKQPDSGSSPAASNRSCFVYAPAHPTAPPAVTIVTPFYNPGAVFTDTAYSVLRQSLQQWEWLIVNDGSTDAPSLALLAEYRARDPRIRVIDHERNRGLSAARNTGFRAARAPCVVQLDSDDLLEPTTVEKWAWFLESYPEFSFVKGYTFGFGAREYLWQGGFHDGGAFLEENLIAPTSAVRARVHHAVGGYDESIRGGLEDWEFWLRCANAGYWGGTVPEYLDWYRRRPTHHDRWTNWDNGKKQRAFAARLRQRYPRLWRGEFPRITLQPESVLASSPHAAPWENLLHKQKSRLVLLMDTIANDLDGSLGQRLMQSALLAGWEVSTIALQANEPAAIANYARFTSDVFTLPHFLRARDYPRFVRYFLTSRQVDVVVALPSLVGYLFLPELRRSLPHIAFVGWWENGLAGIGKESRSDLVTIGLQQCDQQVVTNPEQQTWLLTQGVDARRIVPCRDDGGVPPGATASFLLSILSEASRQHAGQPLPLCEPEVAMLATALAVTLAREQRQVMEDKESRKKLPPRLLDPYSDTWQTLAYHAARRLIAPYYRVASERHKKWLLQVKDTLQRLLLR